MTDLVGFRYVRMGREEDLQRSYTQLNVKPEQIANAINEMTLKGCERILAITPSVRDDITSVELTRGKIITYSEVVKFMEREGLIHGDEA